MTTAADVLEGRAAWSCEAGDALSWLRGLPADCVHCCVTSPPYYGLRSYLREDDPDKAREAGLESTPAEYVEKMITVFREVRRVLRDDGTLWLNLGDSYSSGGRETRDTASENKGNVGAAQSYRPHDGAKPKDLLGIPWRVAFALQADGWYLRSDIIWAKPNPMPESVTDRPGKAHEYVFLLAKSARYFFDMQAVAVPAIHAGRKIDYTGDQKANAADPARQRPLPRGRVIEVGETRNLRTVWTVSLKPFKGAHFAVMPKALVEPCVKAGASERGVCPQCASPWKRKTKRTRTPTRPGRDTKVPMSEKNRHREETGMQSPRSTQASIAGNRDPQRHCTLVETVGWQPGCECGADPVPAVVMDPFAGSGTVAAVAVGLGRRFVGCDLNANYLPLVAARMATVTPPAPQSEAA